jgi:hypothetical protein
MLKKQEDKLGMYDSVLSHHRQQSKSTEAYPALQNAYTVLDTLVADIRKTAQLYQMARKGQGTFKNENKTEMAASSSRVAGAIFAWATDNKNTLLQEKVRFNQTEMLSMRDETLVNTAEMLYALANENQSVLADYGLGKEAIEAYKQVLENYRAAVPAPRNAVAMRRAYREKLRGLFKEADSILKNKIGNLALPLKKSHPEYWDALKANRRIVGSAVSSTGLRIVVKAEATGQPIEGANIQVDQLKLEAHTDKNGELVAKPVPLGSYTATVKATGYQLHAIELSTTLGKTNTMEILLKKAM